MTATEIVKRNKKSEQLKVLQTDDGQFFVESGEGKILYNVTLDNEKNTCTCGDFAKNSKKDPDNKRRLFTSFYKNRICTRKDFEKKFGNRLK